MADPWLLAGPNGAARFTVFEFGGREVPEDKIRSRYQRLWRNVAGMIEAASSAVVFGNSSHSRDIVATFTAGDPVGSPRWLTWMHEDLAERWP